MAHFQRRFRGRVLPFLTARMAALALLAASPSAAAPGDVLFTDTFESDFGKWSTTHSTLSGINTMTASY